ncbi:MAG: sulfatase, partial [Hymenobacteraceae bacterium]|nr:sulfatase [Hymenobacteraceae bacterium]MDX5443557.1 sulfatase [Hymenobacteraceae bacterium]MDX5511515.1 sulfatase [Hymenobacteraceae bacterium]
MKRPYFITVYYFLFWLLYFAVARGVFLLYHNSKAAGLSFTEISKSFLYGLRLDASFAAYICVIPFLLYLLQLLFRNNLFTKIISGFTYVLLAFISLLVVTDLELYKAWGFRLDATPLQYIDTPAEMAASAGAAPVWLLALIFLLLAGGSIWLYI